MKFLFTVLVLLLLPSYAFAWSYVELYPKDGDSRLFGYIEVVTCTDGDTVQTDCGDSHTMQGAVIEISTGTITLPTAVQGMWACVKATAAGGIYIDVQPTDAWMLDGAQLSTGNKLVSGLADDDTICFYSNANNYWTTIHNPDGFADGGS